MKKKVLNVLALSVLIGSLSTVTFNNNQSKIFAHFEQDFSYKGSSLIKTKPAIFTSPNDPYYTGASTATGKSGLTAYQNISFGSLGDMEYVWERYQGEGVTVAVIDSGIDVNHPDFQNKIDSRSAYFYYDSTVKTNVGLEYIGHDYSFGEGYNSHGTNVAGVVGAAINDVGTVGVAPKAKLLVLKTDFLTISIDSAIRYAITCGAKVINLSLGVYAEPYYDHFNHQMHDHIGSDYKDYFVGSDKELAPAINYAHSNGAIVVAAGGNECTETNSYPACNDHVIGVGALHYYSSTTAAQFSNFNKEDATKDGNNNVDIMAPGFVCTTDYKGDSSTGNSTYTITQGTSFACPIVAGAAALWMEKHPTGTPEEFEEALYKTAKDIYTTGWDTTSGYGSLNIFDLMTLDDPEVVINPTSKVLKVGEEFKIEVGVHTETTSPLLFESVDSSIASVDSEGNVTAKKVGETYILVKVGETTKKCKVSVIDPNNLLLTGFGCGGNIATTSILLSATSFTLIGLIFINKYINKKKRK